MDKANELNELLSEPKYKTVIGHYPSQKNRVRVAKPETEGSGDFETPKRDIDGGCTLIRRTSFADQPLGKPVMGSAASSSRCLVKRQSSSLMNEEISGERPTKPPRNPDAVATENGPSGTTFTRVRSSASFKQPGSRARNNYIMQQVKSEIDEFKVSDDVKFTLSGSFKSLSATSSETSSGESSAVPTMSSSTTTSSSSSSSSSSSTTSSSSESRSSPDTVNKPVTPPVLVKTDALLSKSSENLQRTALSAHPGDGVLDQIESETAKALTGTSCPPNDQPQYSNTAVVLVENSFVKDGPTLLTDPLMISNEEASANATPPPSPPPPPPSQVIVSRNSFNNLIKLDIRPIEMVALQTPAPAPATASSPLPPPPPASMVRAAAAAPPSTTTLMPANSLLENRCPLRRNSSFPSKTAFGRRASFASAAIPAPVGPKIAMNGSLQYHDVRTKIQQFEKIRADASTTSVATTAMSSSSVCGLGPNAGGALSRARASFLTHCEPIQQMVPDL